MDLLLDSRLLNLSSFNSLLFENSRDKLISQFDTFASLGTLNQPVSLQLWVVSLISACIVGMIGLIPLCFIPFTLECISSEKNGNILRTHLSLVFLKRISHNYWILLRIKAFDSFETFFRLRIRLDSDSN